MAIMTLLRQFILGPQRNIYSYLAGRGAVLYFVYRQVRIILFLLYSFMVIIHLYYYY